MAYARTTIRRTPESALSPRRAGAPSFGTAGQGASNFQRFVLQTGTALHETDATFDFGLADWNRDGAPDLVTVKKSNTGTNSTEVHILGG